MDKSESKTHKGNEVRKKIRSAAAELFQERGYNATSMRELAQRVQLEASSLYNYIRSKEELLKAICFENSETFLDGIKTIDKKNQSIRKKLEDIIELHINIATQDIASATVFTDEWRHLKDGDRTEFLNRRKAYENHVLKIMEHGMAKGEINKTDSKIAVFTFLTALKWIHYWYKPGKIAPEILAENMKLILLDGLCK